MDGDKDFCSKHQSQKIVCEKCNRIIAFKPHVAQDSKGDWHYFCGDCAAKGLPL